MLEWQDKFNIDPPLTISVNLSGKQFGHPDLVEQIKSILEETGFDPHCLKLEMTEGVIMSNTIFSKTVIQDLRELGIDIPMDDFGTGYSSLGTLHNFPLDAIKMDRTFVSNMAEGDDKLTFVRTIVNLARDLGLGVIAEGVETEHQVQQLKSLECNFTQGFYYSKAVDSDSASKLIIESQKK